MEFLYLLEKIRNPVFDFLFLLITHLGEEIAFLAIAIIFFWCVDKRRGYFILLTGLVGTVINQALKLMFKIPRPWIKNPNFTFVGDANVEATGYSFPSGHTQNTAGTFGTIGLTSRKRWVRIACIVIIALAPHGKVQNAQRLQRFTECARTYSKTSSMIKSIFTIDHKSSAAFPTAKA